MRDGVPDRLLQRMLVRQVRVPRQAALPAIGKHAAVLAGAIVVQGRERHSGRRQFFAYCVKQWRMHTALQLFRRGVCALQHISDGVNVPRLAGMAGTEQRHLLHRVSEALHAAASDKGHRLQRL